MKLKNYCWKSKKEWNELFEKLQHRSKELIRSNPFLAVFTGVCAGVLIGLALKVVLVLLVLGVLALSLVYMISPDDEEAKKEKDGNQ